MPKNGDESVASLECDSGFKISLEVITLSRKEKNHFYGPDEAILINNTILIKGPAKNVLRLIREQEGERKGKFEEISSLSSVDSLK